MIDVVIDISGFSRRIKAIASGLSGPDKLLMDNLAEAAFNEVQKNFTAQGRPKWAGLAPSTLKYKKKSTILVETDDMRRSLGRESAGSVATVTVAAQYAAYHQFGTGKMPARPFMTLPPEAGNTLADAVADYIDMLAAR